MWSEINGGCGDESSMWGEINGGWERLMRELGEEIDESGEEIDELGELPRAAVQAKRSEKSLE